MEPSTSTTSTHRGTAWAGIAFAVLYVAGVILMIGPTPGDEHKDQPVKLAADWSRTFADSGKRTQIILGAYVVALACIAMVVFGSHLRDRLAGAGAAASGRLAFAGSIMFGAMTLTGAVAMAWIPATKSFGDYALPTGEITYLAPQLAFGLLLVGGGVSAALMLGAAGWGATRSRALPGWLGWAGLVIGVLVFAFGAFFMPMLLLVLWVLVAAIVSLRRPVTA